MTPQDIAQAAESLFLAEQSRKQIGLLSVRYPEMTLDDAYAVQKAFVEHKVGGGARVVGWKIGLTSRAMQDALKITTPDSGVLLHDMVFFDGDLVPKARFIQPRVEAEIAFLMKTPLHGAHVSRADVVAATEFVAPSLEILDTRILRSDPTSGRARIITDTVADNAANAGIVLGKQRHAIGDRRSAIMTCDGSGLWSSGTGLSRKPGWAQACWTIRCWGLCGWCVGWPPMDRASLPAIWCCRARSFVRLNRHRAARSMPILASSARFPSDLTEGYDARIHQGVSRFDRIARHVPALRLGFARLDPRQIRQHLRRFKPCGMAI